MTKRDEAVFAKAFEEMEAEGCFDKLRAKTRSRSHVKSATKPAAKPSNRVQSATFKTGTKLKQKASSSRGAAKSVPLVASKK